MIYKSAKIEKYKKKGVIRFIADFKVLSSNGSGKGKKTKVKQKKKIILSDKYY